MKSVKAILLMALGLGLVVSTAGQVEGIRAGDEGNSSVPSLNGHPLAEIVKTKAFNNTCGDPTYCSNQPLKGSLRDPCHLTNFLVEIRFPDGEEVIHAIAQDWQKGINLTVEEICKLGRSFITNTTVATPVPDLSATEPEGTPTSTPPTDSNSNSTSIPNPATDDDASEVPDTTETEGSTPSSPPDDAAPEFSHLSWFLPLVVVLVVVMLGLGIGFWIHRYTKRAGYQSSAKNANNGEGGAAKTEGKDVV